MPYMSRSSFSRFVRLIVFLLFGSGITACTPADTQRIESDTFFVFGTLVDVQFANTSPELAQQGFAATQSDLEYMHYAWHAWQPGPLGRTNKLLETTAWFSATPSVLPVIQRGRELTLKSGGFFDPAIGHLIRLWGFQRDEPGNQSPREAEIRKLVAQRPSMADIEIEGIRMRSKNPAVRLDLGGYAKGYALDRIVENLRQLGIKNAILNAGGDLRAYGSAGNRPWHIGIRHPRKEGIIASLDIQGDESVFTSGDYERYFDEKNRRQHHILDPRTGYPVRETQSVTVIHAEAATADAAATALFVAGPKHWHETATAMGIRHVMLIDQQGRIYLTPAMQARIKFEEPVETPIVSPEIQVPGTSNKISQDDTF